MSRADVVIVGGGIKGLRAALGVHPLTAPLLPKSRLGLGSSSWLAQGGVAVASGQEMRDPEPGHSGALI